MAFLDTAPRKGDSDNNLLFKIAQELSEQNGGAFAPMLGDSDNLLLQKILQGIILSGSGGGACAADLATCQAAAVVSAANLAACTASLASLQSQYNDDQSFRVFASTTPSNYDIASAFGYSTNSRNFPGLLSLTFLPDSTIAGYLISGQTSLLTLSFPNLTSIPLNALANITGNTVLTSISFPALTSLAVLSLAIGTNISLTSINAPLLVTSAGIAATGLVSLPSFSLPALVSATGSISLSGSTLLISISLPVLQTATNLALGTCPALTSINLNSLVSLTGTLTLTGDISLGTLSLPLMTTVGAISASGCTVLSSVSFPNYLPTNGSAINFSAAALSQVSVDHVLARAVANAAYVSGTITLDGGTSSTPSGAGLADKATLIARGVTVLTN